MKGKTNVRNQTFSDKKPTSALLYVRYICDAILNVREQFRLTLKSDESY